MKRKTRGGHHRAPSPKNDTAIAAKCIISFAIAALIVAVMLLCTWRTDIAGGAKKTNSKSPKVAASLPASPLGGDADVARPVPENVDAAVTTLPTEPLEGGGQVGNGLLPGSSSPAPQQRDRPAIEAMQGAVVEAQAARERQAKINAITSYMVQYHGAPGLIALAPLIVDTATATGMDCRMAPCTAAAESTCGAGSSNLFGYLGGNSNSWDAQVIGYYNRIAELNAQHGWNNNWMICWYWYGGGSETGADGTGTSAGYADNVIRDIQSIGW